MKARAIFQRHSRRTPAEGLNRAVYYVVRRAQQDTPVTPTSRIDTELKVSTSSVVSKTGNLRKKQSVLPHTYNFSASKASAPLAALIINAQVMRVDTARSQPGMSNYNRRTGMRYARLFSPFKGVSRRTGAAKMTAAISRLVKARHSSTGFLKHSWTPIWRMLQAGMPKSMGGGSPPPTENGLGIAFPAQPGAATATCIIENRVGMSGSNATLDAQRNAAAHRILAPILQRAIDSEFELSMQTLAKKGWLEDASRLRSLGFEVTV